MDEDLYSRQLFTLGKECMNLIITSKILISCNNNIDGLVTEIIKNTLLVGVKEITIHIKSDILKKTNYYLDDTFLGKPFIDKYCDILQELNHNCNINYVIQTDLIEDFKNYQTVVFIDYPIQLLNKYNIECRNTNTKFIAAQSNGLFGYCFNDFNNFISNNSDGEDISQFHVENIIDNKIIKSMDNHKLYSGDIITIIDTDYKIKVKSLDEFYLVDDNTDEIMEISLELNKKIKKNMLYQKKLPHEFIFKTIHQCFTKYNDMDYQSLDIKIYDYRLLYAFWKTILFNKKINTWETFKEKFKVWYNHTNNNNLNMEIDDEILIKIKNIYFTLGTQIIPVNSVIGSIVSQEIIKSVSNKFTPLKQTVFFDFSDILPNNYWKIKRDAIEDYHYNNFTNNNSMKSLFGNSFTQYLEKQNIFIVGAGAIGCEHGKNIGSLNCNLYITDMDNIEKSNLNRQFLFREHDIGKSKSLILGKSISKMTNGEIFTYEKMMSYETENIFNKEYYENIDIILNALDNVKARIYMSNIANYYQKPIIDSGTLGLKASIQTIIPNKTKLYSGVDNDNEEQIPICTLKMFPYKYEHLIQYARDYFEGVFVKNILKDNTHNDIEKLAIDEFMKEFNHKIIDILDKTKDKIDFWDNKLKPIVLTYDNKNKLHKDFIKYFVKLYKDTHISNKFIPIEFEKDDDTNNHIDFIHTFMSLRGQNYGFDFMDKLQVKKIAGKIIPAISTTTSLISGLVAIDTIKILYGKFLVDNEYSLEDEYFKLDRFQDGGLNMATQVYAIGYPDEPFKTMINDTEYNEWDLVNNDLIINRKWTIEEILEEHDLIENNNGEYIDLHGIYYKTQNIFLTDNDEDEDITLGDLLTQKNIITNKIYLEYDNNLQLFFNLQ
jgi:ubiquitin-activating enzyme E1